MASLEIKRCSVKVSERCSRPFVASAPRAPSERSDRPPACAGTTTTSTGL